MTLTDGQVVAAGIAVWVGVTGLIAAIWAVLQSQYAGRLADRDKSEGRAWELVTALRAEAAESNRVIDKLADTVRDLREAIRAETARRR